MKKPVCLIIPRTRLGSGSAHRDIALRLLARSVSPAFGARRGRAGAFHCLGPGTGSPTERLAGRIELRALEDGHQTIRRGWKDCAADSNQGAPVKGSSEVVYQVLWPKERKGESVLIEKSAGRSATGALFTPPASVHPLEAGQMKEPLFGSDLSYEDVVENFFAWEHQAITGAEVVDGVSCQILESKPGKGEQAPLRESAELDRSSQNRSPSRGEVCRLRPACAAHRDHAGGERRQGPLGASDAGGAPPGSRLRD